MASVGCFMAVSLHINEGRHSRSEERREKKLTFFSIFFHFAPPATSLTYISREDPCGQIEQKMSENKKYLIKRITEYSTYRDKLRSYS